MTENKPLALVTGGSQGIGAAICRRLARDGYAVIVGDLVKPDSLLAEGIVQDFVVLDVTRKDTVTEAVQSIENRFGPIEVLCNNAGVSTMNRVVDLTEREWDFNFNVNMKGVFLMTQAVLPAMMNRRRGVIINTASMAGTKGVPLLAHYAASKWAVIGFTKSVALEVAPYGIRVNAVCPGYVRTGMQDRELVWEAQLRGMTPDAVQAEYIRLTPLGRIEEPEDVARVVGFLASDDSRFITGEAIHVTGGANL